MIAGKKMEKMTLSPTILPTFPKTNRCLLPCQSVKRRCGQGNKGGPRLSASFANVFQRFSPLREQRNTVTESSPLAGEDIVHKWQDVHGYTDNLLNPLDSHLRQEIVKYGEFSQATYDALDFELFSEYCGSCRYGGDRLFQFLGLEKHGYTVTKYIYALSHVDVPNWLDRSHLFDRVWSRNSNWMGFIAVSNDEETRRIGRRDVVVAWRGTVAPSEWYKDFQRQMEPMKLGSEAKVEAGFHHLYTAKRESSRYNKMSASEQVMQEVKRLVDESRKRDEEISLSITGHSLGGALALLNAYEAASSIPGLPISVVSFGAPRAGNIAFREELKALGVKALRVVIKQDFVPKSLGFFVNEGVAGGNLCPRREGTEARRGVIAFP